MFSFPYGQGWGKEGGCKSSRRPPFPIFLDESEKRFLRRTKMINFFLPMKIPTVTQQEHKVTVRNGKPVFYEPAELKAARMKFRDYLARYKPEQPLEGPIELKTIWMFFSPEHTPWSYKTTKPDTDNLVKMFKDEMTRLHFWKDDAQVCVEVIEKIWAKESGQGIFVHISELDKEEY